MDASEEIIAVADGEVKPFDKLPSRTSGQAEQDLWEGYGREWGAQQAQLRFEQSGDVVEEDNFVGGGVRMSSQGGIVLA